MTFMVGGTPQGSLSRTAACVAASLALLSGCGGDETLAPDEPMPLACRDPISADPPACGSGSYDGSYVLPGPAESGHDAALAAKALRYDRTFHAITAVTTGLNTELSVPDALSRNVIESFVSESDAWSFDAHTGVPLQSIVGGWHKVAGAYGGAGVAADAFRYGTLRDQAGDCESVDRAREQLLRDLDGLHLATAITGVEGVIARGFARTDVPGDGATQETTALFDADGNPLPPEKNNGTWREDNSGGEYPNYIWEDSCSRDQLAGWALGYAAAWEVMRGDPTFPEPVKQRLQVDAAAIARSLSRVGEAGYDLEIHDADGRVTYHGLMHEDTLDRIYAPGVGNGFAAILALGVVAAFAYVAEDPRIDQYLHQTLVSERGLHVLARDQMMFVDMGVQSNFSNYNMAFVGGWLGHRYLCDDAAREVIGEAIHTALYAVPGRDRQPTEQKQTLYDFVYAAAHGGGTAFGPVAGPLDQGAVDRGLETLNEFADAPFWEQEVVNCDEQEIASSQCEGLDGTPIVLLGYEGRGDKLVAEDPVPMRIRPGSNYYWRSNPYEVNGGGNGTRLLPGVDFRLTYWMGRWLRR